MTTLQLHDLAADGALGSATHATVVCTATALQLAEAAYAADADHLARQLLVGLLLRDRVEIADVQETVTRGLARFNERARAARSSVALR